MARNDYCITVFETNCIGIRIFTILVEVGNEEVSVSNSYFPYPLLVEYPFLFASPPKNCAERPSYGPWVRLWCGLGRRRFPCCNLGLASLVAFFVCLI